MSIFLRPGLSETSFALVKLPVVCGSSPVVVEETTRILSKEVIASPKRFEFGNVPTY